MSADEFQKRLASIWLSDSSMPEEFLLVVVLLRRLDIAGDGGRASARG